MPRPKQTSDEQLRDLHARAGSLDDEAVIASEALETWESIEERIYDLSPKERRHYRARLLHLRAAAQELLASMPSP